MDKPKCWVKKLQLKVKVKVGLHFLTQNLGLSIFYPKIGFKQSSIVYAYCEKHYFLHDL